MKRRQVEKLKTLNEIFETITTYSLTFTVISTTIVRYIGNVLSLC